MKNMKRCLSLILSFALLITSVGLGFINDVVKSDIQKAETLSKTAVAYPIHFYVPETIYLTPASGNATTFKYYVDSTNSTTPALDNSKAKTTGNVYFYCVDSTAVSIACSGASVTLGTTTGSTTISTAITAGTLTAGIAQKATSVLTWTATYTVAGVTMTAKAYTVCYAPPIEAIGVAQRLYNSDGIGSGTKADLQGWFYVSGVQGYGTGGIRYFNQTSGKVVCPMLGTVTAPSGNNAYSDWITGSSGGVYYGDWSGGDNQYSLVKLSPTGLLTVDTSRYTDINQIPNFTCGMAITNTNNMDQLNYYIADYDDGTTYITDTQVSGNTEQNNIFRDNGATGSQFLFGDAATNRTITQSIVYGGQTGGNVYSNAISGTGTYAMRLKAASWANNDGEWNCFACLVNVTVTKVSKSTLRTNMRYYTNLGLQAADYSNDSADFSAFQNELSAAASKLGNPTGTDTSDTLSTKYAALTKNSYTASVNHVFSSGKTTVVESQTFNSGDTVTFGPNTYTGYTLSSASGYTTSTSQQSVYNRRSAITQNYNYTANTFNVAFNANNGSGTMSNQTYTYNTAQNLTANAFTRTGYSFAGWNTAANGSGTAYTNSQSIINLASTQGATVTMYAQWSINSYNLTFNANGGTGGTGPTLTQYNAAISAPTVTRTGYTLTGWSPGVPSAMPAGDSTYAAQWAANTNTLYKVNHSKVNVAQNGWDFDSQDTLYGTTDTTVTAPINTYPGFHVDEEGLTVHTGVVAGDGSLILTRYYRRNFYNITFNPNGGSGGAASTSMIYGGNLTAPSPGTRTGYTFTGWSPSVPATVGIGDTTYTAQWSVNTYYVLFDANGASGSMTNQGISYATSANLAANAFSRTGYTFTGWNTAANGSGTAYVNQASFGPIGAVNVTLYAQWSVNSYTVTFDSNGGSTPSPTFKSVTYEGVYGTLATVTRIGYTFSGWYTAASGGTQISAGTTVAITAPQTLYAQWNVNSYTISFNSAGGTALSPITQDYGTTVTAPANPSRTGYTFTGWSPAVPPVMPAENIECLAQWSANIYLVSFNANGGSVSPASKDVTYDSTYGTLPAPDYEGYSFNGWFTSASGGTQMTSTAAVAIAAPQTLYAQWTMIPADYETLDEVVSFEFSAEDLGAAQILDELGQDQGSVYLYGNASQRQAVSDAYDDALALQAMAPLADTTYNRGLIATAATALSNAITTLHANPNPAVYTYVDDEIEATGFINLNRFTQASLDELQSAADAVVAGKNAVEQATVNAYAAGLYNERAGSSALVEYQDTKAPKLNVYETTDTMLSSGITVNGFNPEDFGDISYVYPNKAYYTYYCYTNSESPAIMVNIADLTDSNGRISYPTNMDVSKVSGLVNNGWMSYTYDSGTRAGTITQGSTTVNNSSYENYTIGMNYDVLGSDYYKQSGYLLLKPEFVQAGGKQFARYTISGVDDSSASGNTADMTSLAGGTTAYQNGVAITTANTTWTPAGTITIYVEYRNSMSLDNGTWYDDGRAGGSLKAYNNLLTETDWVNKDYLYRVSGGAANDEIISLNDTVYPSNDPDYSKKGLACFYYWLDDTRDAAVISAYEDGAGVAAATELMKSAILTDTGGVYSSNILNWSKTALSIGGFDPNTSSRLAYVHLVDRWGNVFNKLIKTNNVDAVNPSFADIANGSATLDEAGGSGIALLKLYEYAYEGGPQYVVPCYSDKLISELNIINEPDNVLEVSVGYATVVDGQHNRFTMYTKDNAGNEKTQTVFTDAAGNLTVTVNDPENMNPPQAKSMGAKAMSNTANIYTFLLNDILTVNLNNPMQSEIYTITFDLNGGSSAAINPIALEGGAEVTIPPNPTREGYTFTGWSPAIPTVMPEENVECIAQWTISAPVLVAAENSTTVINSENHFIYGLEQGITQESFESMFVGIEGNGRLEITLYDEFGQFGTGTKVELIDNATEEVVDSYYVIIYGDLNGDGNVSVVDGDIIYNYDCWFVEWNSEIQPFLFAAGDVNGDGFVNLVDGDILYNCDNWLMYIEQTTGLAYE